MTQAGSVVIHTRLPAKLVTARILQQDWSNRMRRRWRNFRRRWASSTGETDTISLMIEGA